MDCPKCGYVMDPFDTECPRCQRLGPQAVKTATAPRAQDQEVNAVIDKISPAVQQAQVAAQQRMARQAPINYGPPLGWPLTILLWIYTGLLGLYLIWFAIVMIAAQSQIENQTLSSQVGGIGLIAIFGPLMVLLSTIAMLRCKRWGFWVFTFFVIMPVVSALIFSGINVMTIILLIFSSPAIAIFVLALTKWDEFD